MHRNKPKTLKDAHELLDACDKEIHELAELGLLTPRIVAGFLGHLALAQDAIRTAKEKARKKSQEEQQ
jgi:hypothetical protein